MTDHLLTNWCPEYSSAWNASTVHFQHALHLNPLFGIDALTQLIESYPRCNYALVQTSLEGNGQRRWREGEIAGATGSQVIEAIQQGSMWLNLRDIGQYDPRYAAVLGAIYDALACEIPGFNPGALKMGILISSPKAQVHYHCDLPGQLLWQIHGRKRVYLYPPSPPYLAPESLENIALSGFEFKLDYRPEFDRAAQIIDLEPGFALSWPLNSPHRIDNHDCLNISLTTEHWTAFNRRSQKVNLANAVLRHYLHFKPASRSTQPGPTYLAKSILQAAWRRSHWAKQQHRAHRPIEFRLSGGTQNGIEDIAQGKS